MDINGFIQIFKESFDEVDEIILPETKYKELEHWTSMQALLLIAHIDDTINIVLEAEDIMETSTINELYEIVRNK